MIKISPLLGGWRKKIFKLSDDRHTYVLATIPKSQISKKKLINSIYLENLIFEKYNLGRQIKYLGKNHDFYFQIWKYIPGEIREKLSSSDSKSIGRLVRKLHNIGICHNDIKPSNIIWKNNTIVGLIDFEEAECGNNFPQDIANTLSWLLTCGGLEKDFWSGYGNKFLSNAKLDSLVKTHMQTRIDEGNKQTLIELARKKLSFSQNEIKSKIISQTSLADFRQKNKSKKIILSYGAFEMVHWGHLAYLKKAKSHGDLLVVVVASDESRRRHGTPGSPIIGEKTRAETMAFFDDIDRVVIGDEDNLTEIIKKLKPDVFFTAKKDWDENVRKQSEIDELKKAGGKLVIVKHLRPKVSSTNLITSVALIKAKQIITGKARRQPILKVKNLKIKKEVLFQDLENLSKKLKPKNKSIVFTSLSADLFHLGHARFIQKAKSVGDILVVGVPSNTSITALKGPGRPIVDERTRMAVLAELKDVDHVVVFDERTILGCLQRLKPDVFFTVKEDWNDVSNSVEAKYMVSIGGKIVRSERQAPYLSSSKMIAKAAGDLIKFKFRELLAISENEPVLNADQDIFDPISQLTAREKGFYEKVWKKAESKCVFCDLKDKYVIKRTKNMVLTVALFPYIDGHLLIIPKRHIENVSQLNGDELSEMYSLVRYGTEILHKNLKSENMWILTREGDGIKAGKTVRHAHIHVFPYDPSTIKVDNSKLSILPINLAKKLRSEKG